MIRPAVFAIGLIAGGFTAIQLPAMTTNKPTVEMGRTDDLHAVHSSLPSKISGFKRVSAQTKASCQAKCKEDYDRNVKSCTAQAGGGSIAYGLCTQGLNNTYLSCYSGCK